MRRAVLRWAGGQDRGKAFWIAAACCVPVAAILAECGRPRGEAGSVPLYKGGR